MKTQTRVIGLILLLCMASLFMLSPRCEAQVKEMSAQELTIESTSIFHGKCTRMESEWSENGDMILTRVTVIPDFYLKGDLGNEVTITVPGGRVGDIIYEVSEMPSFQKGEEVFAFIWKHPSGLNLVTGGYQGKIKISKDPMTGKKVVHGKALTREFPEQKIKEAVSVSKEPDQTLQKTIKAKDKHVSLDDFTREVKGYLNEQ